LQHFVIALFFEPYLDVVELDSGCAVAPDQGCARAFPVRGESGRVWLDRAAPACSNETPLTRS